MEDLTVVGAITEELEELAKRDPALARSTLAASALALARALDDDNSATSKAQCARSLIDTLECLDEKAPEAPREETDLDRIRRRRAERLGGTKATG